MKKKIENPFEPVFIEGSSYDPFKDEARIASEKMFNDLSKKEQREFLKDLEEDRKALGFEDDKKRIR